MKITALILVAGLIAGGWYLGGAWWKANGYVPRSGRLAPRWESWAVTLALAFLTYIAYVIDRGRPRH